MSLPPVAVTALDRCTSARASVHNHVDRTGHSIEFRPEELVGLLRGRIHRLVKRAFQCFELGKTNHKFQREFNVELHGMNDNRELMARYNARREAPGLAEFDGNVSRLREAVHESLVNRSRE